MIIQDIDTTGTSVVDFYVKAKDVGMQKSK
jgi:orotate phosphoribosyltransferase